MVESKGYNVYLKFGILCDEVQNLTLQLGLLSGQIQNEFGNTQYIGSWKSNFLELAQVFSRILHTIPDIEHQEKHIIAKGNLFDSAKYINSLRQDILTPLVSLKSFLEEKRQQLIESQQELTRVMASTSNELIGNTELATIRGAELLTELDNNITQLDEMIAKMG